MVKKQIARACALLLAGATVMGAAAMPARKGLVGMTQPDGTIINVRLTGDENFHYYTTEDGYMLVCENDYFYYAAPGADGNAVSSGIRALPAERRSDADKAYLATLDNKALINAYAASRVDAQRKAIKRMPAAKAQRMAPTRGQAGPGLFPGAAFPTMGEQRALVILVEYSDISFKISNPHEYFERLLNEEGFSENGATGSARDFFVDASSGVFKPHFDVYGPVKLPNRRSYYGSNDQNGDDVRPEKMIIDACDALDETVDFSLYDGDKDGFIDNVIVYYAGKGENDGGGTTAIWPHAWNITDATSVEYFYDGVQLDSYACTNEVQGDGSTNGIGTVVHEFSHVLGLPDMYSTTYTDAFTPGEWDALDYGSYNNNSTTPPTYSGFERYAFGWLEPEVISGPMDGRLENILESNRCYIIPTGNVNEYFILENRQPVGWDTYLPGHGMLIWHIDYNEDTWTRNTVNNNASHQGIDIEEADDHRKDSTRNADVFPGPRGQYTSFTDDTRPSMRTWGGAKMNLPITDICEEDGVITFKVSGGAGEMGIAEPRLVSDLLYSTSFTVEWDDVEYATNYLVTLTDDSDAVVAPYDRMDVGATAKATFSNLKPQSTYKVVVVAKGMYGESEPSQPLAVTTLEESVATTPVTVLDATEIEDNSFVANWSAMDDAEGYLLSVFTRSTTEPYIDSFDFTGGIDGVNMHKWTTNAGGVYNSTAYCGKAAPSLKLDGNGKYLATCDYEDDISAISFWLRGASADAGNRFALEAKVKGEWRELGEFEFSSASGSTFSYSDIPVGTRAMRITYRKTGVGNLAIDDVVVEWGGDKVDVMLDGYDRKDVGNVTSFKVEGLLPATAYYYTVHATKGDEVSPQSGVMQVVTTDLSGIAGPVCGSRISIDGGVLTAMAACGEKLVVSDLSGRVFHSSEGTGSPVRVVLPRCGIWIVRCGNEYARVMVH